MNEPCAGAALTPFMPAWAVALGQTVGCALPNDIACMVRFDAELPVLEFCRPLRVFERGAKANGARSYA